MTSESRIPPSWEQQILDRLVVIVPQIEGVEAIALSGSAQAGFADAASDLDVYVYWRAPLADAEARASILRPYADPGTLHVDVHSWGLEDWLAMQGRLVELIYVSLDDIMQDIDRAYDIGLDGDAFTTSWLYNVAWGESCYDPAGHFSVMRDRLNAGFPEATRRSILQHRTPALRNLGKSIRLAQQRDDLLMVQQLRAEAQQLFFNLLFTLNRMYHPGSKRLLLHSQRCLIRPTGCEERWVAIARLQGDDAALAHQIHDLALDLLQLIEQYSGLEIPADIW